MRSKILIVGLLLFNGAPSLFSADFPGPPKKLEVGRKVVQIGTPDFTLTNQEGRPFHMRSLRGKVVLVSFIYTTCPDVCPLLTARFSSIQRSLREKNHTGVYLVSITTDPEVDIPKVLKAYAERFEADFRSWVFLTGDEKELSKVWEAFGVKVKKRAKGLVQHTGFTTLIDRQGARRVDYLSDSWTEKEVLKDIVRLVKEP